MLPLESLSAEHLRDEIDRVLTQPAYRQAAVRMSREMQQADGLNRAADLVETAVRTGAPVLRGDGKSDTLTHRAPERSPRVEALFA